MGRFFGEKLCSKCGKLRCECPSKGPKPVWVIDPHTLKVRPIRTDGPGMGWMEDMNLTHYFAEEIANAELPKIIGEHLERCEKDIASLLTRQNFLAKSLLKACSISESDYQKIRTARSNGYKMKALADGYNVSVDVIRFILKTNVSF